MYVQINPTNFALCFFCVRLVYFYNDRAIYKVDNNNNRHRLQDYQNCSSYGIYFKALKTYNSFHISFTIGLSHYFFSNLQQYNENMQSSCYKLLIF